MHSNTNNTFGNGGGGTFGSNNTGTINCNITLTQNWTDIAGANYTFRLQADSNVVLNTTNLWSVSASNSSCPSIVFGRVRIA